MRSAALFSPRFHPVLDGGKGNEDAVIAPQVPGSQPIRQAVVDHQPYCQGNDPTSVVAVGGGQVREINVEVLAATGTTMLGIGDHQFLGAVGGQITQVMQPSGEDLVPIGQMPTQGALAPLEAASAPDNLRLRQVFNTRDSFRRIRRILAGPCHPDYLPEDAVPPAISSAKRSATRQLIPVTVLQCLLLLPFSFSPGTSPIFRPKRHIVWGVAGLKTLRNKPDGLSAYTDRF